MRDELIDLTHADLGTRLPRWTVADGSLRRTVEAPDFPSAIAWVVAIADAAEELDHHPDIDIRWRRLHLLLTTHDSGGITERDVDLAMRIDAIVDPTAR
jgi:4a-hydroxytetrahydrobiopterin dehydratase